MTITITIITIITITITITITIIIIISISTLSIITITIIIIISSIIRVHNWVVFRVHNRVGFRVHSRGNIRLMAINKQKYCVFGDVCNGIWCITKLIYLDMWCFHSLELPDIPTKNQAGLQPTIIGFGVVQKQGIPVYPKTTILMVIFMINHHTWEYTVFRHINFVAWLCSYAWLWFQMWVAMAHYGLWTPSLSSF